MVINWSNEGSGDLYAASWMDGKIETRSSTGIVRWNADGDIAEILSQEPQEYVEPQKSSDKRLRGKEVPYTLLSDGTLLAWSTGQGIRKWESETSKAIKISKPKGHITSEPDYLIFGDFTDGGDVLVLYSSYLGWAEAFNVQTGEKIAEAGAFGEYSEFLVLGDYGVLKTETHDGQNSEGRLQVFELKNGRCVKALAEGAFLYEFFHHRGRIFFIKDGNIQVWDLAKEQLVADIQMPLSSEYADASEDNREYAQEEASPIYLDLKDDVLHAELLDGGIVTIDMNSLKPHRED